VSKYSKYYKTRIYALSWSVVEIIQRCTVSKTSNKELHLLRKMQRKNITIELDIGEDECKKFESSDSKIPR